jgi:DNA-3-methyladenine glycosylase
VAAGQGVAAGAGADAAEGGRADQAAVGSGDTGTGGAGDTGTGGSGGGRGELLPRDFFARPSQRVAPDLLGCVLESELPDGLVAVALTEVEAYAGQADPASHAYRGPTRRNAVMFGEPGHAYVYFTYGMHFCVNLVCMPEGTASAVLLRAGAVVAGADLARRRRIATRSARTGPSDRDLARGPARLCQALGIDRALDGADACDPRSVLRIRRGSQATPPGTVRHGPRVGISRAADEPWRFWVADDPTVSAYRAYVPRRAKASAPR